MYRTYCVWCELCWGPPSVAPQVSKKSHVYLQPVFWNLTTVNFTANVNAGYEKGLRELRKKVGCHAYEGVHRAHMVGY